MQQYFESRDFPKNLPAIWDDQWGFAATTTGRAVVIGEWGGEISADPTMKVWADELIEYMKARCLTNNFYWSLNPDSDQTGGLLKK